jgi:hypothetical protein
MSAAATRRCLRRARKRIRKDDILELLPDSSRLDDESAETRILAFAEALWGLPVGERLIRMAAMSRSVPQQPLRPGQFTPEEKAVFALVFPDYDSRLLRERFLDAARRPAHERNR